MATKITGGTLRGRKLQTPAGARVRPTTSRVRESLFSILGHHLGGITVLDLCAGAGTLGIEAASRGASRVVFVEQDRRHAETLRANAALLEGLAEHHVIQADATRVTRILLRDGDRFDLVFLDPPYATDVAERTLTALGESADQLLADDATIAVETDRASVLPDRLGADWTPSDVRTWGRTKLTLYTKELR
ncbi:MAG: 16S rRNA (guanine(966)-N(2))-methyltransferase RsmD [Proteobacteria bacterium]|nr:16S rRNA (guanine(966)-N(2))-methyltransferase RsmD [Pseudomonadota bacterium]